MKVIIFLLSFTILGCSKLTNSNQERITNVEQKPSRPIAFNNGKFFTEDGHRMLYGGQKANQHFNISNSDLQEHQFHYGLGRELFPALLKPAFISVEDADLIWNDNDRFLVAYSGDEVKAYAVKDLTRHEIVNDELDGKPIMAAYCILADLGAIYERTYGDHVLTFALSGYTYYDPSVWNGLDGFLLWDRDTESLWWPLIDHAVSGPLKGVKLLLLDETKWEDTSWEMVKDKFKQAQVLKSGQDFTRPASWDKLKDVEKIIEEFSLE